MLTAQEIFNKVYSGSALTVFSTTQEIVNAVHDASLSALRVNITQLAGLYVKYVRYEQVGSLTGTLSPPAQSTIVLDQWPEGVDALPSGVDSYGRPTRAPILTSGGTTIAASLALNGTFGDYRNYALSGTPAGGWPCTLMYAVRSQLINFQDTDSLFPEYVTVSGSGTGNSIDAMAMTWMGL